VKNLEATVTLEYKDEKTAKAISEAVSPDNFRTPVGLQIQTEQKNNRVMTRIEYQGKLATFIATIDDLLFSASTAEKTLHIVKKGKI
jgi:hypothetical protein